MKIIDLQTIHLEFPLDEPIVTSFGRMGSRTSLLVRVQTDEGLSGLGEAWSNFPPWGAEEKILTINKGIKPLLVGKDPCAVNALFEQMYHGLMLHFGGKQWGAPGPIHQAISAVDVALWDLWGQAINQPIYALLGGPVHDRVSAYASGLGPGCFLGHVEQSLKSGYKMFKLKVGFGLKRDLDNMATLRQKIGPGLSLMIDANQAWSDAREAVKHLKQYQIYSPEYIEEPVMADRFDELAALRSQTDLIVAGGENLYGISGFRQALSAGALGLWQPDITKTGGFTQCRMICNLARAVSLPWAPHMFGTGVGLAASLHLLFGLPGGLFMEVDANPNPLRTDLLEQSFYGFDKGRFEIKRRESGLGITLNEFFIQAYKQG